MSEISCGISKEQENKFPLKQVYFYLTEGCNLACRHCWLSPKVQDEHTQYPSLAIDLFESVIQQGKELGLTGVKLTGGEPFMHPGIMELIKIVIREKVQLGIESNGVLCTPEIAELLATYKGTGISVSLDGSDEETHEWVRGKKGCFQGALQGIKNLVKVGIYPQVIFTVMEHNKGQVEQIVRLAESLGAGSVKFNVVQPTGRGEKLGEAGNTLTIEELLAMGDYVNSTLAKSSSIRLYYDYPLAFRPLSKMYGPKGDGCASCGILQIIGVLANGHYALCGIGSHVPELIFGHAGLDRLADVWKSNRVIQEMREGVPGKFEGICGNCHMKRACVGSCIAQNYYRLRNIWAPYWFCELAAEKGLFPRTRMIK